MGHFFTITAIRTNDSNAVAHAVLEYSQRSELKSRVLFSVNDPNDEYHATIYTPVDDWCVIEWPRYFSDYDGIAPKFLSERLSTLASTIDVHYGDYWRHIFYKHGAKLDDFNSMPSYWFEDDYDTSELEAMYKGSPANIASELNIDEEDIAGYYEHIASCKKYSKVHPDDRFELDDFWVFVDYWRKLGIQYPVGVVSAYCFVDLKELCADLEK